MANHSPFKSNATPIALDKENITDKHQKRPVNIHFKNEQEAIDLYIRIQFKYFLMKLLYSNHKTIV